MRNRLTVILLALAAVAVAAAATLAGSLIWPEYTRIYQHRTETVPQAALDSAADVFTSHLPLVWIQTGGVTIQEDVKQPVMISVIDNENNVNRVTDAPALTTASLMNIRGKTSASFEKLSYRLNFIEDLTTEKREAHAVMGMPSEIDWVLYGPYLDKTLLRNYLMYNLAGEIMEWAPNVRFCELFIDGAYEGLYVMTEAVTVDKNRVNVSTEQNAQGETGYLLYRDIEGHTKTALESYGTTNYVTSYELGVEFPNAEDITEENIAYILSSINTFEASLFGLLGEHRYEADARMFAEEMDVQSFVNYFIINELAMNRDAGYFSTYAFRDPRGKLTMGPVWDFNNCLDNHIDTTPYEEIFITRSNWFDILVQDEVFVETLIWRYKQLRKTVLNEDRLLAMIDEIAAYLGPAIDRNYTRWDDILSYTILGDYDDGTVRNAYTYQEAIDQLKSAIIRKGRFLDENLAALLKQNLPDAQDE